MIKGTLILPFSVKSGVNNIWFDHFRENWTLDPKEWKVVLFDTSGYEIARNSMVMFDEMGFETVVYDAEHNRFNLPNTTHWPTFMKMGMAIAHVWNDCRKHVEGKLVLMIEDDILIPKNGFETLIYELSKRPSCGIIGAIQRTKNNNTNDILAWQSGNNIDDNFFTEGIQPKKVGSMATGMIVTYADLFKSVDMTKMVVEYHASQDIAYCRYLNDIHNLETVIDPRVETYHVDRMRRKHGTISHNRKHPYQFDINYKRKQPVTLKRDPNAPIFLCGFLGRTGSTWIQRILMSHHNIMMYGEPQGAMTAIDSFVYNLFSVLNKPVVKNSKERFKEYGAGGFIPNLNPDHKGTKNIRRAAIKAYYGIEPGVWGIKSINWTPTRIMRMFRSFPTASFIFINRERDELKTSFEKVAERWWGTTWEQACVRLDEMEEFMKLLPVGMHNTFINHTKWKDRPEEMCTFIEDFLDLETNSLNREVAKMKLSFTGDEIKKPSK